MLLFLLVDMNFVALWGFFGGFVTVVLVRTTLPGMFGSKRRSGEQREKQNRRKNSLHKSDRSTRALNAGRKSRNRHQKMNGRVHTAWPAVAAMPSQSKRDGGDDGDGDDGDAVRKPASDLRTSLIVMLLQ